MRSVPYNLYAILTLFMVLYIILTGRNYGPMAKSIAYAKETGKLYNEEYGPAPGEIDDGGEENAANAKPLDMLFPILLLIVSAVILFPMTTYLGAIDGKASLHWVLQWLP